MDIAKNGNATILYQGTKLIGRGVIGVSLWGAINDAWSMGDSAHQGGGAGSIKVGDAISFFGNTLGIIATSATLKIVATALAAGATTVTAPAWVTGTAVGSLALGVCLFVRGL